MKTQSDEEEEVKYNVAQSARGGNLMKLFPTKIHMMLVRVTPQ